MALKREDFVAMGRREFGKPGAETIRAAQATAGGLSWQNRAWAEGYDAEKATASSGKLHHEPVPVDGRSQFIFTADAEQQLKAWPVGAAENLKAIARDFNIERGARRRARLLKALVRMQKRYGHLTT